MGGGGFIQSFVHVDKGGGYVECPHLSTRGGEGVKIRSKLVHVVVECPLGSLAKIGCPIILELLTFKKEKKNNYNFFD